LYTNSLVICTGTVKLQVPTAPLAFAAAGMSKLFMRTDVEPTTTGAPPAVVKLTNPAQPALATGTPATVIPAGKVSVRVALLTATKLRLLAVTVSSEVPGTVTSTGLKDLEFAPPLCRLILTALARLKSPKELVILAGTVLAMLPLAANVSFQAST
jgi:hypothetical protein